MAEKTTRQFTLVDPLPIILVNLLEPHAYNTGTAAGEPKYGATLLVDPASDVLKALKAEAAAVAKVDFPGVAGNQIAWPFKSGDKANAALVAKGKKPFDNQAGKVLVTCRSPSQPRLSVLDGGQVVDLVTDESVKKYGRYFSNGAEALVQIAFASYGDVRNLEPGAQGIRPGVTVYLNHVLITKRPANAGRPGAEVFKGVVGHLTAEDPTQGAPADDDIPY